MSVYNCEASNSAALSDCVCMYVCMYVCISVTLMACGVSHTALAHGKVLPITIIALYIAHANDYHVKLFVDHAPDLKVTKRRLCPGKKAKVCRVD